MDKIFKFKVGMRVACENKGSIRKIIDRAIVDYSKVKYLLAAEEDLGWEEEWVDEKDLWYLF